MRWRAERKRRGKGVKREGGRERGRKRSRINGRNGRYSGSEWDVGLEKCKEATEEIRGCDEYDDMDDGGVRFCAARNHSLGPQKPGRREKLRKTK